MIMGPKASMIKSWNPTVVPTVYTLRLRLDWRTQSEAKCHM
jgi:hypothetical protein